MKKKLFWSVFSTAVMGSFTLVFTHKHVKHRQPQLADILKGSPSIEDKPLHFTLCCKRLQPFLSTIKRQTGKCVLYLTFEVFSLLWTENTEQ